MKNYSLTGLIASALIFGLVGFTNATVITFDSYTNIPHIGGEVTGEEWLSEGIVFSTPDTELNLGYTMGSPPNSLGANITTEPEDFSGAVSFEFINNNFVTDLYFTIFNTPFQAEAFDVNGTSLHTISSGSDFTQYFDFSGFEVHSVMVTGTEYAIDDVTFTLPESAPVPEPATMFLFSVGLAALAGSSIGRKRK